MGVYVPDFPDNIFESAMAHCKEAMEDTYYFRDLYARTSREVDDFIIKGIEEDGETPMRFRVTITFKVEKLD